MNQPVLATHPTEKRNWSESFKAFSKHLLFSAFLVISALFIIYHFWYPAPLHQALGVKEVVLLIVFVDLFVGPVCTFVVYKKNKKGLWFDFVVILVLQLSAFIFGIYSLFTARPVFMSFYPDRFNVVRLNDIEPEYFMDGEEQPNYSITGPKWIAAKRPSNFKENPLLNTSLVAVIANNPTTFYPLSTAKPLIIKKTRPFHSLAVANPEKDLKQLQTDYPSAIGWVPLHASHKHMVVLLNATGDVIDIIDWQPWSANEQTNSVSAPVS